MRTRVSTPTTRNKPGRRSASEWRALTQAFSHSGVTRAQFCIRHRVALSTFDWWRSRLRQESTARSVSNTPPSQANAQFVELVQEDRPISAASSIWDVELDLGSGVFLRLRRGAC